ncbi:MAG TPA: DUF190 domain-containing protein [Granulicella sp.]
MPQTIPGVKVTLYLNRDTTATHGFLHEDILRMLAERGIRGASVLRPYAGFGAHHMLHTEGAGPVAGEHLPVLIVFVEEEHRANAVLPELLEMVTDGMVEAHPTQILKIASQPEKVIA